MTPDSPELAGLSERRKRFVLAYAACANASAAAEAAGYAHPGVEGCRLLKDAKVAAAIAKIEQRETAAAIARIDEIQEFLSSVMRGEVGDPVTNLAGEYTGVDSPPKIKDRIKAAETLAKMHGAATAAPAQHLHVYQAEITPIQAKAELRKLRKGE